MRKGTLIYCAKCKTIYAKTPKGCPFCRITALEAELEDYKDAEKFVSDPPHDQICCGCVAILRKQLASAEKDNKELKSDKFQLEYALGESEQYCSDNHIKEMESHSAKLTTALEKIRSELRASSNRLRTVLPVLPNPYRKSVEVQLRFNDKLLAAAALAPPECVCGGSGEIPLGVQVDGFDSFTICPKCKGKKNE